MKSKKIVQEYPKKAWEKESAYTRTSWKRDEDNKSAIHARQGQRVYPRRKGDRNKSLHIDMPMKKRGIQQRWAVRKRPTLKANLSSEEWMRKPNWVHIAKTHMYPQKRDKSVFYSKDLREIRELCRATLLYPDLEKMDKNNPNRLVVKRRFKDVVGEHGRTECKCYVTRLIYDRMENEVVTAFPSLS